MSIRPDRYSCQSWNVAVKVILKSFARGHSEELSEDIQEETETAKETVSESEVFVTALNDTSTALETCLEDLSDHSVSEIATISDTLVNTDDDSSLTKVLDSDSSRTVKIQDSSASDTLMASEHKQNLQSQLLSAEEPTNHATATLPKAILDMCDKATDKLRNSLLFENISGDLQCASDVERLNKIIHEKENYSSPTNITVQQMATKRRNFLDSSSSSILVNDSSLTNTLLVTPSLQISKTKTLDKIKSVLSETVNKNSRMNRNNNFSSSETLCIDESLSKTLVDDQEVLDSTIVEEEQEVSSVSQTILAESHKNSKKEKSKEDSSFDKTLKKIDSSSSATILVDNSSLTNTLLVTPCSSITKTKNKSQPILSQPVFKKDRKNRYTELSSSDTLCIDESLSEQSLSPSILDKKQGVSSVLKTVLSENNRNFKQQISRLDESREHTLQDISIYGDEKTDTSLSETMLLENTLTDQSKDKTYHCQNSSSSVTLHGTDMLNINPKRNTNSASQESSCSKTLQLDTSVFDIAMDKSNNQEHYDKKIQFGKGPKSALFVKIKNRYEQSTSENEDFNQLLPYKDEARFSQNEKLKYLKETKLEDTECLDNQKKIPWAKETLASEIIETRENIGLKYKHSNVIGKLNSLYQSEIKTEKNIEHDLINTNIKYEHIAPISNKKDKSKVPINKNEHENKPELEEKYGASTTNESAEINFSETSNIDHYISYSSNKIEQTLSQSDRKDISRNYKKESQANLNTSKKNEKAIHQKDIQTSNVKDNNPKYTILQTEKTVEQNHYEIKSKDENVICKPKMISTVARDSQYDDVCSISSSLMERSSHKKKSEGVKISKSEEKISEGEKLMSTKLLFPEKVEGDKERKVGIVKQEKKEESSDLIIKQRNMGVDMDKGPIIKQDGKNPFENESKIIPTHNNPFEESVMVSPRRRLKTPTSNAKRDLLGGGNKNNLVEKVLNNVERINENTDNIDTIKEQIQIHKSKEKNLCNYDLQDTHVYEEIVQIKRDQHNDLSCKKDEEIRTKNHIYDELKKNNVEEKTGILGQMRSLVFKAYTAMTPWWLARRMYWKKEKVGEEVFAAIVRRNSKTRTWVRTKHCGGEDSS